MRKKIIRRAAFIIFAATIFIYPGNHFSPAVAIAQPAEAEQEAEAAGNQQKPDALSPQEEQLREEAEAPQGPDEQYVPGPGDDESQPQGPSEEYVPDPGYDENQPQGPSEEYVPDPGYDENQPQDPSQEDAPDPGYEENQPQGPSEEYAPEQGDEAQPMPINEEQPAEPVESGS